MVCNWKISLEGNMTKYRIKKPLATITTLCLLLGSSAVMGETTVNIAGWGAKSGPLRSFGVNSEAIIKAAVETVNKDGGITLANGSKAKLAFDYYDSGCNAEQGIAVARKVASETNALIGIGPTCSGVAAASFGVFQKKLDDNSDTGLQFPLLTDTAVRNGLAKISQWTFRNTPNEPDMYDKLFAWIAKNNPDVKTIYGGTETDQGHSAGTYSKVIVQAAVRHGFEWVNGPIDEVSGKIGSGFKNVLSSSSNWLMGDTNFSVQARSFKKSKADLFIVSAHPFTTCGFLKELYRQKGMPKMLVGLTSSSSAEVMKGCAKQAEGMIIPTSFAPITDAAKEVAAMAENNGGSADLHSAAAWENVMIIKQVMESVKITGDPAKLQEERRKIRDGLEALETTKGLLGTVTRVQDEGEALKPYVFVQAKNGSWDVVHDPR
jgi:branched-chain amino acid transport system substrate-binding protein